MEFGFLHQLPPELAALLQGKLAQPEIHFKDVVIKDKERNEIQYGLCRWQEIEFKIIITTNGGRYERIISTTITCIKELLKCIDKDPRFGDLYFLMYPYMYYRCDSIVICDWVLTKELSSIFVSKLRELVQ